MVASAAHILKIGMIQRRLAWPLHKDHMEIHEAFHIFNHNEVPFHTSQNGCDPNVYKQYMLERVWRKENPLTLLVGMQTSTATTENSVGIP